MMKTIKKKMFLILIIMIVFFAGQTNVKAEKCTFVTPMSYINENNIPIVLQYKTHTDEIEQFLLKCDSSKHYCEFGIKTNKKIKEASSNPYYFTTNIKYNGDCNEEYIRYNIDPERVESESVKPGENPTLVTSTNKTFENTYKDKLNKLYLNKVSLGSLAGIVKVEEKNDGFHLSFAKYISSIDGIVLVNTSFKEKYPAEKISKFKYLIKNDALEKFPIDQSEYNEITYNRAYYDATKDNWWKYMNEDIINEKEAEKTRKYIFEKWYKNVNRYIFEEDLSLFKKYFIYLYSDRKISLSSDGSEESGEKNYNSSLKIIDSMLECEDAEKRDETYNNNKCSSLCPDKNSTEQLACMNGNSLYIDCVGAAEKCSSQFVNVPESYYEQYYDECMKSELGEDRYNELKKAEKKRKEEIDAQLNDAISKIIDSLTKIDSPSISGIEFEPYEAKCEDVVIFHKIYRIMTIMAPILVILLGSIDYAQAVFSSDEKKMQESKKKFPKRIALLVLFVAVPTIISIIMSLSGGETNLMKCVILGK